MNSIYSSRPWLAQYRVTPPELSIPDWSMIDAFERTARKSPSTPAIYYFDETISFGALDDLAARFATLLAGWGIGKGDRVAVSLQNDPEFAVVELGAWKRGAILVPLNPMFKEKEVAYHLTDSGSRVWIVGDSTYVELARTLGVERVIQADDLTQMLAGQSVDPALRVVAGPEDIAFLV